MNINISKYGGFCPGVKRADAEVRNLLFSRAADESIYIIGELIHNDIYNAELKSLGAVIISFDDVKRIIDDPSGKHKTFVICTHGISRDKYEALEAYSRIDSTIRIVDLTCPSVKRIHEIAKRKTGDDTLFVLFGDKDHSEVTATITYASGEKAIIGSLQEANRLDLNEKKLILCSQTTQNLSEFKKIKKNFKKLCTNPIFFDTICNVTENRQTEAIEIAKKSDVMIIVGDRNSANSNRLYEICKEICPNSQFIESTAGLTTDFPDNAKSVGITAGASTPDGIILEVLKTMENFSQMLEGSLKTLHTGETVTGTVFTISENEIKLDLGAKFTGVLTREQITDDPTAKLSDMFKLGDEVDVFVIRVEDGKGLALSLIHI